jgi:hypothetical protein
LSLRKIGKESNQELINICLKYEKSIRTKEKGKVDYEEPDSPIDSFLNALRLGSSTYFRVKDCIAGLDYIPLFKLLDILIDSHYVFHTEKDTIIFKDLFNCYLPLVHNTLEEVGKRLGVTRERVRQIREAVYRRFFQHSFKFIKTDNRANIFHQYIQSTDLPIILITDEEAEKINQTENTNFSALFISFILSELFSDIFIRVGDRKILFGKAAFKETCLIKHLFLVNRTIDSQFQFERFLDYLTLTVSKKREEDEKVTYIELIGKFKSGNATNIQEIVSAVNTIVVDDFTRFIEIKSDGLNFFQNKKKTLPTRIIDVLRNSSTPLHFSEIYRQLISNDNESTTEQSVHSILINRNKIFGLKGFGIFDLRSKGGLFGTICSVAEQLLREKNKPIPIQELENLICKELVVNKNSIQSGLFYYGKETFFEKDKNGNVSLKEWHRTSSQIQMNFDNS